MTTPLDTLTQIQQRLQAQTPMQVIDSLAPWTRTGAETWVRRMPVWSEYSEFTGQVIAIARIIGQRAMRTFGLRLTEDGRVVDSQRYGPWQNPKPSKKFTLTLSGEEVRVEYAPGYFPDRNIDHVYFLSPHEPEQPHPLSETGYWSMLVSHDVIEACGGVETYATLLADAELRGQVKKFIEVFEGKWPEPKQRRKRQEPKEPDKPVIGQHTAQIIEKKEPERVEHQPLTQKSLFDGLS